MLHLLCVCVCVCRRTSWTPWSRLRESPWSLSGQVCLQRWACLMGAGVCGSSTTGVVALTVCTLPVTCVFWLFQAKEMGWLWILCRRLCPASTSAAWSATLALEAAPLPEQRPPELLLLVTLQVSLVTAYYGRNALNGTSPPSVLCDECEPR